jgi:thioredoxin reductase
MSTYDVVIIGGGPAGLGAALTLTRARRTVLVIDSRQPRNAQAAHAHNYLGLDGIPPRELLERGRAEVAGYGGEFRDCIVVAAHRDEDGRFTVRLADESTVRARRLVIATGVTDELPPIPGLAQRWGRDVVHCPYCHGWEARDQPIGIIATGQIAVHQAQLWRQWSEHITLFRNDALDLTAEQRTELSARDVTVVDGAVRRLEIAEDAIAGVRLAGRTRVVPCRVVVVGSTMNARADGLATLGLTTTEVAFGEQRIGTRVASTDPTGATEVPGVWVAGNVDQPTDQVISAAANGTRTGAMVNADLVAEDTRTAVAARQVAPGFTAELEREVCAKVTSPQRHGI